MTARRTGIGIEVTPSVLRGVVIDERAGRVVNASEVAVSAFRDDAVLLEAFALLHHQLDADLQPVRLGWFPTGSTLQRVDASGLSKSELNALRRDLDEQHDHGSSTIVDSGARRWLVALRWNENSARRIRTLAQNAEFADPVVEPAPMALARVVSSDTTSARRDGSADLSWAMIVDSTLPSAATTLPAGAREFPSLHVGSAHTDPRRVASSPTEVTAQVFDAIGRGIAGSASSATEMALELQLAGDAYPPFPAHDLRAPQRLAVALGAALGAAGFHGSVVPIESISSTRPSIDVDRRPWTLERLVDVPDEIKRRPPWWRRLLASLGIRRRSNS